MRKSDEFFQEARYDVLGIYSEKDEKIKKIITNFKEENVIWKPKFKNFEEIIQFLLLKKDKINFTIIYLKKLDFEDSLMKEILKMNDIQIYIEGNDVIPNNSIVGIPSNSIREIEIHISSKADKFINKIEDNKVTKTKKTGNQKITVIFSFWKSYNEDLNQQNLKKAINFSDKTLENILNIRKYFKTK